MKIVFFGTPEYVLPVLTSLHKKFVTGPGKSPIVAVVTQSPKPTGRKQILTFSKVDKWAHEKKVPTYYKSLDLIENDIQADLGVLAAYGEILPPSVLKMFPHGILNIHPSLLPKLRGASPIQGAIVAGEKETGVSVIKLDEKLDHGPVVTQFKENVLPGDDSDSLRARLFERSADVLTELVEPYLKGKIKLKPQDDSKSTFTRLLKKENSLIPAEYLKLALEGGQSKESWEITFMKDFSLEPNSSNLFSFIRAMASWPGAWSYIELKSKEKKRLKILKAHLEEDKLVLDEVQLEGKDPVTWNQLKLGYPNLTF